MLIVTTMRLICSVSTLAVPKGVKVSAKGRTVTVTGPRGELKRSFMHRLNIRVKNAGKAATVEIEAWFGDRRKIATIRTVKTHIENMIIGVTKGFMFKMRLVYAHFPIIVNIEDGGQSVDFRNFLGEKIVRPIKMLEGVTIARGETVKDELVFQGNSLDNVSQSAALVRQCALVRNKDIRKFLDGIYVSFKGNVVSED